MEQLHEVNLVGASASILSWMAPQWQEDSSIKFSFALLWWKLNNQSKFYTSPFNFHSPSQLGSCSGRCSNAHVDLELTLVDGGKVRFDLQAEPVRNEVQVSTTKPFFLRAPRNLFDQITAAIESAKVLAVNPQEPNSMNDFKIRFFSALISGSKFVTLPVS